MKSLGRSATLAARANECRDDRKSTITGTLLRGSARSGSRCEHRDLHIPVVAPSQPPAWPRSPALRAERLHLALCNLAWATQRALPLSTSHLLFDSRLWEQATAALSIRSVASAQDIGL